VVKGYYYCGMPYHRSAVTGCHAGYRLSRRASAQTPLGIGVAGRLPVSRLGVELVEPNNLQRIRPCLYCTVLHVVTEQSTKITLYCYLNIGLLFDHSGTTLSTQDSGFTRLAPKSQNRASKAAFTACRCIKNQSEIYRARGRQNRSRGPHPRSTQNEYFHSPGRKPHNNNCSLRGCIRKNWNDTEKISMAPAQG